VPITGIHLCAGRSAYTHPVATTLHLPGQRLLACRFRPPPGLVHPEVIRWGKSKVLGILEERIDQIGLLTAPDLIWDFFDLEGMFPDKTQPLLPVLLAIKLQFHIAPPN